MTDFQDRRAKDVTPLSTTIAGLVLYIIVAAMAWYGGGLVGEQRAWEDQQELTQAIIVSNAALEQANQRWATFEPWLYLTACNPDPVSHQTSLDEMRALLVIQCNPAIVVPEGES